MKERGSAVNKLAVGAVVALGGALVLSGCAVRIHVTTYHETSSYEVSAAALKQLAVSVGSGDVQVTGGDGTNVRVTEYKSYTKNRKPQTFHSQSGDTLNLGFKCPGGFHIGHNQCEVNYTIQVPKAAALRVDSGSGNLRLSGLLGAVQARTSSGDIFTDGTQGNATLQTGSGNVSVNGSAPGSTLQVQDSSGDILLRQLSSTKVQAHTDSGNVQMEFRTTPGDVNASSSSGDVMVGLPKHGVYAVTADTSSGEHQIGVTNDPNAPLKIKAATESGNVNVYPV